MGSNPEWIEYVYISMLPPFVKGGGMQIRMENAQEAGNDAYYHNKTGFVFGVYINCDYVCITKDVVKWKHGFIFMCENP